MSRFGPTLFPSLIQKGTPFIQNWHEPSIHGIHGTKGILQIPLPWRFGLDRRGSCVSCGLGSKGKKSKPLERGSANQAKSWWIWENSLRLWEMEMKWRWNGLQTAPLLGLDWIRVDMSQHGGRNVGLSLRWPPRTDGENMSPGCSETPWLESPWYWTVVTSKGALNGCAFFFA